VSVAGTQQATFTVVATGNPAPTYQWFQGYQLIGANPSRNMATLTIPSVHLNNVNSYRVRITNSQGFVYSNFARLTISSGNTTNGQGNGGNNTNGGG